MRILETLRREGLDGKFFAFADPVNMRGLYMKRVPREYIPDHEPHAYLEAQKTVERLRGKSHANRGHPNGGREPRSITQQDIRTYHGMRAEGHSHAHIAKVLCMSKDVYRRLKVAAGEKIKAYGRRSKWA